MNSGKKQRMPVKYKTRGRPWLPGISGNPAGRPKGALNKLSLAVKGEVLAVNEQAGLEQAPTPEPVKCDFRRGHTHTAHKIGGVWRRTVEQDGLVFDRQNGVLITGPFGR